MRIFVAASYSAHVNYDTGEVFPDYKEWLESELKTIEAVGHTVFCALRADNYKINDDDPAVAFSLDIAEIEKADALIAYITDKVSAGVQTEVGYALAKSKKVYLASEHDIDAGYFNKAIVKAGQAKLIKSPIDPNDLV